MKPLKIGDLVAKIPIIQGGMGVGVSLSSLAGAVAKEGGIGVLSAAQIGYDEPDFEKDPEGANMRAMKKHIRKAREIAPDGIIGINIMVATRLYANYVKEAIANGIDLIISGAGLPTELPALAKGSRTSDIDLAVLGGDTNNFALAVDEETSTLLMYDIVDLSLPVQEELKDRIYQEGIVIYEKI